MTRLDDEEALILAQARIGLGPSAADERRVLQSLRAQIGLGAVAPSPEALPKSPWPLRVAGAIAVVGAIAFSGGLGYQKGLAAGIAQRKQVATPASKVLDEPASPAGKLPPSLAAEAAASVSPGQASPAPSAVSEARALVPSAAHIRSAAPAASAALGLDEEVRQLRRVERAIREGNPRFALVLLEDLNRVLPAGQLLEERRAAGIMANCQLGADGAVTSARAFATKHTGSAYLTRVIELCGLGNGWNSAAAGTHTPRSGD